MIPRMAYQFDRQLVEGEAGEAFLDAFFTQRGHSVRAVSMAEQRQGIDRIITTRSGQVMKVEYKTDHTAARTGNAFVETISVDTHGKMGWALTSQADYLVYLVPGQLIIVLPFQSLRWALPGWMREYPERTAANNGYETHGVLVPLPRLLEYAVQTFPLGEG